MQVWVSREKNVKKKRVFFLGFCFHIFPPSILSFLRVSQIWNSSFYFPSLEESKSRRRRHLINHQRRISAVLAYCADFLKQDFWSRFVGSCGRLLEAGRMCGLQHHPQAQISKVRTSNLQGNRSDLLFNTYIRCSIETCWYDQHVVHAIFIYFNFWFNAM